MTLAALEATLRLYLDPELSRRRIPTLRMICAGADELRAKARKLSRLVKKALADTGAAIVVREGASRTGGGAFPEYDLPTWLVCARAPAIRPDAVRGALLRADPPLVARVEEDALCLDPRTLEEEELPLAARALAQAFTAVRGMGETA
jgi:L-seryl-tRNA(Ser) seleniumtransferase